MRGEGNVKVRSPLYRRPVIAGADGLQLCNRRDWKIRPLLVSGGQVGTT